MMDSNALVSLVAGLCATLPLLALSFYGFVKYKRTKEKIKRCTKPVNVECVEIRTHHFKRLRDADGDLHAGTTGWFPVFKGTINGMAAVYETHACVSGCYNEMEVGDRTEIMINPDDPTEWVCDIEKAQMKFCLMVVATLIFFALCFVYLSLVCHS